MKVNWKHVATWMSHFVIEGIPVIVCLAFFFYIMVKVALCLVQQSANLNNFN